MTASRIDTDVSAWIGSYPFRELPHPDASVLVRVLERERIAQAWVGALAGVWHRDPEPANAWLYAQLAPFSAILHPVPTVRPDWPGWEALLDDALAHGAPAVRAYPMQVGIGATSSHWSALAVGCGARGLVLQLTVRFEDVRQRHPMDSAGDLPAAYIRAAIRADHRVHVVVSGAGRELIEETHWSLTPDEQVRLFWDWAWVWGPPEDHFRSLLDTIGAGRFVFGGYWPLRLIQAPLATAALSELALPADTFATGSAILAGARRAGASR